MSRRHLLTFVAVLAAVVGATSAAFADDGVEFFEKRIRPILANHCYECHGPDEQEHGLRLDSHEAIFSGGKAGPSVVSGKPDASLLIAAVRYVDENLQMPPDGKLGDAQIADLVRWVEMGAPHPEAVNGEPPTQVARPQASSDFWAFQLPRQSPLPLVKRATWPQTAIDRFILAKLEANHLSPSPPADKHALLRRATYDLTGLPPTPDEVAAFLADNSPMAFASVVDRLLASPRYGERWGRHWLDIARYADSNGLDENICHGNAWRYRDYVVAAFNADKPYDEFIRQQLAGDLLPTTSAAERDENLVATGYLTLGPKVLAEVDKQKMEMDIIDEQIDTLGKSLLGLTFGCARCHDHKFDPIATRDYYALAGIFKSTRTMESLKTIARWHENPLTGGATAMGVTEQAVTDVPIHIRGSHLTLGEVQPRGFPQALCRGESPALPAQQSGRLELAQWLTSKDHPLTARVMVNRVWRWHFGRGIVATTDNFGELGERPSHPELLDWLAVEFAAQGWSLKQLHRTIMLSATYQMSSADREVAKRIDPQNRWLWRANMRRLEAEEIRDAMLAAGDGLDLTLGGSLLKVENRAFFFDHTSKDNTTYDTQRRSLYLPVVRNHLADSFTLFDYADAAVLNGDRPDKHRRLAGVVFAEQRFFRQRGACVCSAPARGARCCRCSAYRQRVSASLWSTCHGQRRGTLARLPTSFRRRTSWNHCADGVARVK